MRGRCSISREHGGMIYSERFERDEVHRYEALVKALQYLAMVTRYDIASSVDQLAREFFGTSRAVPKSE